MSDDFGATLRGLRLACGLTQEQLAERCGLSVEGISVLERGRRKRPRASTIDALVRGLGLDEDDARRMRQVCSRRRVGETWTRPDQVRPGWALRPAQLPAPPPLHVGRDDLVRAVTDRLREPAGLAPQVVGITGMAGIGKTSLALRVGHAVAPDFPDGQIYLDLRGHHPAGALDTRAALAYLLVSLGVHSDDVPRDADQAAAAYRTLTNGTRLLVVLDDAADHEGAADVAQLLPGTAGNAVVVVSRSGLSAPTSGFHLGRLDDASATELLRHMVGRERTDPDADALRRLVEGCAGLPLALRIVGARLQARPSWSVADLAERLGERGPLVELHCGGLGVEQTLGDCMQQLRSSASRTDRLAAEALHTIGLLPTYAVSVEAIGAAHGWSRARSAAAVDRLVEANLAEESASGQYAVHDLVHAVARSWAESTTTPARRHALRLRVLRHYVALAWRSRELSRTPPSGIDHGALTRPLAPDLGPSACLELVSADADQVLALARVVAGHDDESGLAVAHLALGLMTFFVAKADNLGWPETLELALEHLPDDAPDERVWLWQDLALARSGRGDHAAAAEAAQTSARLAREHDRPLAEAGAEIAGSIALRRLGRLPDAVQACMRGLALSLQQGDERGAAAAWRDLGLLQAAVGKRADGVRSERRSLDLYRRLGVPRGIAMTLINLGVMLRDDGALTDARSLLEEAVEVSRSVGDRALETEALDELGYWHVVAGDPRGGISVLSDGLALVDDRGAGQWEVSIRRRLAMALDGLGRHHEADEHWRTALRRHEQRGERRQAAELRQLWASRVSMRRTGPTRAATSRRTSPA